MEKDNYLIVLTKKYGSNFTGATLATQYYIKRWCHLFCKVIVVTLQCGAYEDLDNVEIKKGETVGDIYLFLQNLLRNKEVGRNFIGYSDDHLGYILSKFNIRYIHTYHGNWPDARWINIQFFLKGLYFIPTYKRTLKNAAIVINVSKYMETFTKKYNNNSLVIHNGLDIKPIDENYKHENPKTFIMVGNIDSRKYKFAVKVANYIWHMDKEIAIHVYGKAIDRKIVDKLSRSPNVVIKGQHSEIPYQAYRGLINTSTIENMPISVCEAIKAGIPAFCFNVGGLPEIVKEGKTGFVIKKGDAHGMANEIVNYSAVPQIMNVSTDIVRSFDWEISSVEYEHLFELLMNG